MIDIINDLIKRFGRQQVEKALQSTEIDRPNPVSDKELQEVRDLHEKFAKHKEGFWIVYWSFAQMLYQVIRENKFKSVLDLGTGIGASAAIMALALEKNGKPYHIDTLELSSKCLTIAKELIPENLQKNITFHKAEPLVWNTDTIPYQNFSTYKEIPKGDYDLIVNDGPGPYRDGKEERMIDLDNGTINKMLIEGRLKSGTKIVFDKRVASLRLLERYYGENFYALESIKDYGFYMLERTEDPLHYEDIAFTSMKKEGYLDAKK